jgi:predicted DNA-binding transcriptional regulator YafY
VRRADRLFRIVQLLRGRRFLTAAQLSETLEVSARTVYRDIADLAASGVRVMGEAGVGYRLDRAFDLPPLMFDADEIQALVLGARMVEAWADDDLRRAARGALEKIHAVLPGERKASVDETALYSLGFRVRDDVRARIGQIRRAIADARKLGLVYAAAGDATTERTIRPLGLYFWGGTWTVGAWCDLRSDYRSVRLDRMAQVVTLDERFAREPPVTLADFVAAMRRQAPSASSSD